jgi:hypothetical protein
MSKWVVFRRVSRATSFDTLRCRLRMPTHGLRRLGASLPNLHRWASPHARSNVQFPTEVVITSVRNGSALFAEVDATSFTSRVAKLASVSIQGRAEPPVTLRLFQLLINEPETWDGDCNLCKKSHETDLHSKGRHNSRRFLRTGNPSDFTVSENIG